MVQAQDLQTASRNVPHQLFVLSLKLQTFITGGGSLPTPPTRGRDWGRVPEIVKATILFLLFSPLFAIQRGVKQGDVLSSMLFNAGLESAFRVWRSKLRSHGFFFTEWSNTIIECEVC